MGHLGYSESQASGIRGWELSLVVKWEPGWQAEEMGIGVGENFRYYAGVLGI